MKGLLLEVYKNNVSGDCTNQGLSSKVKQIIIVGNDVPQAFEVDSKTPAFKVVTRWKGTDREYHHLEPLEPLNKKDLRTIGPVFGGNYAFTNDSRFTYPYPLPIYDRYEVPMGGVESWNEWGKLKDLKGEL